jgi:translation initiation factor 1A
MVKNSTGGNKTKSKARKTFTLKTIPHDELVKIAGQEYAYVQKKFGDGRYELICYDRVTRLGISRGTIKKKSRVDVGNLVLVSLRDFQDNKCDIIHVFTTEECDILISHNDITQSFLKEGNLFRSDDGFDITFEENISNGINFESGSTMVQNPSDNSINNEKNKKTESICIDNI